MSAFNSLIALGVPVDPDVWAVIYNESSNHSFKKSMVNESALKMRFIVFLMESAMINFYRKLEHRQPGILVRKYYLHISFLYLILVAF